MPSTGRAPLPSSVYMRRRLVLATVAALLFFAISHVLRGGSDAGDGEPRAAEVAGSPTPTSQPTTPGGTPTHRATHRPTHTATPTPTPTPIAQPDGDCADSDVSVEPHVFHAIAGQQISLALVLTTLTSPACIWQVSAKDLALKITNHAFEVWSTRECPGALEDQTVVLRNDIPTRVVVPWNSRLSDAGCTDRTDYAKPGSGFRLSAAALGGEPASIDFTLGDPLPPPKPTHTPSAHPSGSPSGTPSNHPSGSPSAHPSGTATALPSGSATPHPSGHASGTPTSHPSGTPSHHPSTTPTHQATATVAPD